MRLSQAGSATGNVAVPSDKEFDLLDKRVDELRGRLNNVRVDMSELASRVFGAQPDAAGSTGGAPKAVPNGRLKQVHEAIGFCEANLADIEASLMRLHRLA